MGRRFFTHPGGRSVYNCIQCHTPFTNKENLISAKYTGRYGKAFLFNKVVNITYGSPEDRMMTTGRHFVADVYCKGCHIKIGWFYEYAFEKSERYKEGCVILERKLLVLSEGIDETCVRVRIPITAAMRHTGGGNQTDDSTAVGKTMDKLIITAPTAIATDSRQLINGAAEVETDSEADSEDCDSIVSGPLLMVGGSHENLDPLFSSPVPPAPPYTAPLAAFFMQHPQIASVSHFSHQASTSNGNVQMASSSNSGQHVASSSNNVQAATLEATSSIAANSMQS